MTAREYAMNILTKAGIRLDDDIGNGLLIQTLADFHGITFERRPRKNRAREILEAYRESGSAALEDAASGPATRNVYVIELDPAVLKDRKFRAANPGYRKGKACLYVGSTCRAPEERFQQHREGYKSCRYPRRYGQMLRPDLYERYNPMGHQEAYEREESLAKTLRDEGYAVWQN